MKKALFVLLIFALSASLICTAYADYPTAKFDQHWVVYENEVFGLENPGFEVEHDTGLPDLNFSVDGQTNQVTVSISASGQFPGAGQYAYSITQKTGTIQGIDYDTGTLTLYVLAAKDGSGVDSFSVGFPRDGEENGKVDSFTNEYKVRTLTVTNHVSGQIADLNQEFRIKVTFTAEDGKEFRYPISYGIGSALTEAIEVGSNRTSMSKEISLKNDATMTFKVPIGTSYTIEELDSNGYTVVYTGQTGEITDGTDAIQASVTNTKDATVNIGISLDSAPYLILLAIAVLGVFLLLIRHRREEEN